MVKSSLDVASESFDADASLAQNDPGNVSLPYPNVAELRNIAECAQLVPARVRAEVEEEFGATNVPRTEAEKARMAAKKSFMIERAAQYMATVDQAAAKDPIQTIVQRVRKGPLMLLRRAYQASCKVDVVTRHARGVKGILRAEIHGFDKFMNLLLANVEEWFAHRVEVVRVKPKNAAARLSIETMAAASVGAANAGIIAGEQAPDASAAQSVSSAADAPAAATAPAKGSVRSSDAPSTQASGAAPLPERTQTRRGWRQVLRKRKLARVLLRGDQVVLVAIAEGPLRLPATLAHLQPLPQATPTEGKPD